MCSFNVQSKTDSQFSPLHEPDQKVNGKKLKRKPLSGPESVNAVRWMALGAMIGRISGKGKFEFRVEKRIGVMDGDSDLFRQPDPDQSFTF